MGRGGKKVGRGVDIGGDGGHSMLLLGHSEGAELNNGAVRADVFALGLLPFVFRLLSLGYDGKAEHRLC